MSQIQNPKDWLHAQLQAHQYTALVFFRGTWCPFCQGYMKDLNAQFLSRFRALGGELFGITAQDPQNARQDWALDYTTLSDPSLALARRYGVAITPKQETPLAQIPDVYPAGMSQPAVVILNPAGDVLYHWAIDPHTMNLGGATDRPLPEEIWAHFTAKIESRVAPETQQRLDLPYMEHQHPKLYTAIQEWMGSQV